MIEAARKKVLGGLNSRYIYGRVVGFLFNTRNSTYQSGQTLSSLLSLIHVGSIAATPYNHILNRDGDHDETDRKVQLLLC